MAIYIGQSTKDQAAIRVGSNNIGKVFVGDKLVWPDNKQFASIKYGALYNWPACIDLRNICSPGWRIPIDDDFIALTNFIGGESTAGIYLKINGSYWEDGGQNTFKFNAVPSGQRLGYNGLYNGGGDTANFWTSSIYSTYAKNLYIENPSDFASISIFGDKKDGNSIRPIKIATTLTHGQSGIYIDPSGIYYRTICIGTQEWVADSIKTVNFANGDWISGFDGGVYTPISDANWVSRGTADESLICFYEDDPNNV